MAEKRMLARAVSQSRKVNSLSLKAALLWTWCVPWFDVSGFLEVEPDFLKANVVLRRKDITEEEIPFLVTEIIDAGLWEEFISSEGKRVVKEIKFFDFQTVRETHEAKSKFIDSVEKITTKRTRKIIPYEIREKVFKRDNHVCQYCGIKCTTGFGVISYDNDFQSNSKSITLDHKIPISKGGDDSIENLITACFHCNASKCDRNLITDRPITDQLQTNYRPTTAEDKINEVKLNEVKREKEKAAFGEFSNIFLNEEEKKKLETKYGDKAVQNKIESFSNSLKSQPKKYSQYKDHYATLNNWLRKDNSPQKPIDPYPLKKDTIFILCPKCGKETTKEDLRNFDSCPACFKPLPQEKLKELLSGIGKNIK